MEDKPMKCLKNIQTGNIIRVANKQAQQMAGITWQYISKSEWKAVTRVPTEKQVVEEEKKEKTISKKAAKRIKLKEKQRN